MSKAISQARPVERSETVSSNARNSLPFALLKGGNFPPRQLPRHILDIYSAPMNDLYEALLDAHNKGETVVLDLETRGTNPAHPDFAVVGIGLGTSEGVVYLHAKPDFAGDQTKLSQLAEFLYKNRIALSAHNVAFDSAAMTKLLNRKLDFRYAKFADIKWHNWRYCTYALYRQLAGEGWVGQRWGLKAAQEELLGWSETNEKELDNWLVTNGYKNQNGNPEKSEMWRAPKEILGHYCALDVESTWLLLNYVLMPVAKDFHALLDFHRDELMNLELHIVWQKLKGVTVDAIKLREYHASLLVEVREAQLSALSMPRVKEAVEGYNTKLVSELAAAEPERYKKRKELAPEPTKYKKDGKLSGNWEKWNTRRLELESSPGEETIRWANWKAKYDKLVLASEQFFSFAGNTLPLADELFNVASSAQKKWLLYDALEFPILCWTDNEDNPQPATDEDALLGMGEIGKALIHFNARNKILSVVEGTLDKMTEYADEPGIGRLHFGMKVIGTNTGRLSGEGGLNLQNLAKDSGYLQCFIPEPGWKMVTFDVAALEPHTLALASQDTTLLQIYGPNAIPGLDVYTHVGSQLGGAVETRMRALGYDPLAPTKEATARVKKEAKNERSIAKVLHLSCIAEGTLVRVKEQGWKRIEEVTVQDIVWDGEEWVEQDGKLLRGTKKCINFGSTAMTQDHEVLTYDGWKMAERTDSAQCVKPVQPSASWADVWQMASNLLRLITGR